MTTATDHQPTILLRGGRVYRHDGDTDLPEIADVLIREGRFLAVGPDLSDAVRDGRYGSIDQTFDVRGKLLLPGFFNAHYHSHDTLQKGCFEMPTLDTWATLAMPHSYPRRSRQELRVRTLVGAVECLKSGMTTVQDMMGLYPYDDDDLEVVLDAYEEVGLRCVFAPQFANVPRVEVRPFYKDEIPENERWRLSGPERQFESGDMIVTALEKTLRRIQDERRLITPALAPAAPEGCSTELWEGVADLSTRLDVPIYTHLYENRGMTHIARVRYADWGGSLIDYLGSLGVLGSRLTLAHSVWLTAHEIETLSSTGTNVALNPIGNLKTRSGLAPASALTKAGVNIGLGCDNCSCSDVQNMFQAMKLHTVLAGLTDPEEGPPFAVDALEAATRGGPRSAGIADLGSIEPGMRADLTVIDLQDISYVPLNSVVRQLVYTEAGRGVETVIVDGRVVMLDRKMLTVDEEALRAEVAEVMPTLLADLAEVRSRYSPIQDQVTAAERLTRQVDLGVTRVVPAPCG